MKKSLGIIGTQKFFILRIINIIRMTITTVRSIKISSDPIHPPTAPPIMAAENNKTNYIVKVLYEGFM